MKLNKIIYILSVMLIIVTGVTCTSCTAEDVETTTTNAVTNIVPDNLEGSYYSPNYPNSVLVISEEEMNLNFTPYVEETISFFTQNIDTSTGERSFIVHYYDGVNITFEYIKDSNDITIVFDDAGVIHQFGQYTKVD